jgi:ribosomal protein S18 acetylase RimI-like enzyme
VSERIPSQDVEIRAIRPSDFQELHELDIREFPGESYSRHRLRAQLNHPDFMGIAAIKDGKIIGATFGLAFPAEKRVHWTSTLIAAAGRGTGIGTRLANDMERRFAEAGMEWCHGECRDAKALQFWEGRGFYRTGEMPNYYVDLDAPYMRLTAPFWRSEWGRRVLEKRRLSRLLGVPRFTAIVVRKDLPRAA